MTDLNAENVIGALALTLTDALHVASQAQAPANITAAALTLVGHEPGMSIDELSHGLNLSHPGAVRLVDRMVAGGFVTRERSPEDRRAVAIFLTAKGQQGERCIHASRNAALRAALTHLTPQEVVALSKISAKLLGALVEDEDHAMRICRLCDGDACTGCPIEAELLKQSAG